MIKFSIMIGILRHSLIFPYKEVITLVILALWTGPNSEGFISRKSKLTSFHIKTQIAINYITSGNDETLSLTIKQLTATW